MAGDINFPTDTAELSSVATGDLIPIYDVSAPGDLKEAQAINIAKTLIDDTSTTATDRTWSVNKSKTYVDGRDSTASTLTNKTIDADNNTITNLEVDNLKSGVIDTDLSSVAGTDTTIPSAKATKAMGDTKVSLTGDQTIAGVKTFSSFPITPSSAPTTDYQTANKKYVDDLTGRFTIVRLSSDVTTTSATLADITGLSASLTSGDTYRFEFGIAYNNTTTDGSLGLSAKYNGTETLFTGATEVMSDESSLLTNDASYAFTSDDASVNGADVKYGNTNYFARLTGVIIPSSSSTLIGRLKRTSGTGTVTVKTGSYLIITKIN